MLLAMGVMQLDVHTLLCARSHLAVVLRQVLPEHLF